MKFAENGLNKGFMEENFKAKSTSELKEIAKILWGKFTHRCILFKADLGSGKTTLIKELVKCKIDQNIATSPSYSLINEYSNDLHKIIHMDLYRLNELQEALDIGIEDYLYSGNWVFIEWPELIEEILDEDHHLIEIEILEDFSRKIIFKY